jgi:putative DNA primase/helicase
VIAGWLDLRQPYRWTLTFSGASMSKDDDNIFQLDAIKLDDENDIIIPENIKLDFNKSGTKALQTLPNIKKLLRAYGVHVRFNVIRKDLDIKFPGVKTRETNRLNRLFAEIMSLLHHHGMTSDNIGAFLLAIGDEFQFNPVCEWIESVAWDGVSRLEAFYNTIEAEDNELKEILLKRWMIGAIAALYEPEGASTALVLVLQGQQEIGKTNWFKNLVSGPMKMYAKDGMIIDLKDKDSVYICLSHWLVELGELGATFKKADLDALKAFITCDRDIIRLPYARTYSRFPRQTVFCGSVNEENYLADKTGNRRFATIACKFINHTHGLDMQQIWAEFKVLYDNGEGWYLDKEEREKLNENNVDHEIIDPIEEKILSFYDWENYTINSANISWKSSTEILEEIGYKQAGRSLATSTGATVIKLNFGRKKKSGSKRLLAIPPVKNAPQSSMWSERL